MSRLEIADFALGIGDVVLKWALRDFDIMDVSGRS